MARSHLRDWTYDQIHRECSKEYGRYRAALNARYKNYFEEHQELAGFHPQLAASFEQAMPPNMGSLAANISAKGRHRHHLSGKSSQALGLGLLGAAVHFDPSLHWLERVLSPVAPFSPSDPPRVFFEHELDSAVLNEYPRVTAIDFFVETADVVICAEIKWAEEGLGRCSCGAGKPAVADCSARVLQRSAYWGVAREVFFLPDREPGTPCPISAGYQAIRNAAAAVTLAGDRQPVFVLLFDASNPYFRKTSDWPGWPEVLQETLDTADANSLLKFRAVSWQELLPELPLPDEILHWAAEKHGLARTGP